MKITKILEKYYENTAKLFAKDFTDFVDESNIDEYLNKKILKLDSQNEILALYRGKNNIVKSHIINKNNFYSGYCDKIWKNLTIGERAQIAKWHFDYLYHRYNFERIEFMFFIAMKKEAIYSFANTGATHYIYPIDNPKKNKIRIEINPEMLFDENQYELAHTIEHEMQHLKQEYYTRSQFRASQEKMNIKDIWELHLLTRGNDLDLRLDESDNSEDIRWILYKTLLKEEAADLTGLKNILKFYRANKKFGITNKKDEQKLKEIAVDLLAENFRLDVKYGEFVSEKDKAGYIKAYNAEKHNKEIAELNALGAILVYAGKTRTKLYKKLHDYLVDYIQNLNWDEEFVKSIYQEMFKLDLEYTDMDYGKAIRSFYYNKYEKGEEISKE